MDFSKSVLAILVLVGAARVEGADKSWRVEGQVVDEQGIPVEDFEVASFWSSNGKQWDETGKWMEVNGFSDAGNFWKDEGVLAHPNNIAKLLPEGRFDLSVNDRPRVSVFAVDKCRERGGFVSVERSAADKPVTITIVPLVRVTAKVYCSEAGRTPDWSIAVIHPPGDRTNYLHFTNCGSVRGEISLLLPPGKYDFDVHSESPDASMRARSIRTTIPRRRSCSAPRSTR